MFHSPMNIIRFYTCLNVEQNCFSILEILLLLFLLHLYLRHSISDYYYAMIAMKHFRLPFFSSVLRLFKLILYSLWKQIHLKQNKNLQNSLKRYLPSLEICVTHLSLLDGQGNRFSSGHGSEVFLVH